MEEQWKAIPGYEGKYEASTLGRIRSVSRVVQRGARGTYYRNGKVLRLRPGKFLTVSLSTGEHLLVHNLLAITFLGPRPEGTIVRHLDGDKRNNRVENLAYGTRGESIHDGYKSGKSVGTRRLRDEDVLEIRRLLSNGIPQCEIGRRFNVAQTTVSNIKVGKTFNYL